MHCYQSKWTNNLLVWVSGTLDLVGSLCDNWRELLNLHVIQTTKLGEGGAIDTI